MIQAKKKLCSVCGNLEYLFRSNPPTCSKCVKKKPINKISDKHKETLKEYKVVKAELIAEKLKQGIVSCEIKSPVCKNTVEGLHHIKGKSSKELYLDKNNLLMSCNACNNYLEVQNNFAFNNGFKLHRNQITE
jgi:hypothetical protein